MWLFTDRGFFSVVQKPGEADLTVRARFEGDLEHLRGLMPALGPTTVSPRNDYRFRAKVSHAAFAAGMAKVVEALTYSNFKSRVGETMGWDREGVYHRVWDVMHGAQEAAAGRRGGEGGDR